MKNFCSGDCLLFTEDLFIDGSARCGDIFRVYRGTDGPIGFRTMYDEITVFRRVNNKKTKERAKELDDKYNRKKGKNLAVILEPCFRRCHKAYLNLHDVMNLDIMLSEAPSMTALGQIKRDRTYVRLPNAENLFLIYNRYQEERHLALDGEDREYGPLRDGDPIVKIPEENMEIHSRCLLVRIKPDGEMENLCEEDFQKASTYFYRMQLSLQKEVIY